MNLLESLGRSRHTTKSHGTYLTDPATLLTENLLGVGGTDDDVGDGRGHADLNTGVSLLSELALEELVQLGVEDTVGDELPALADVDTSWGGGGHID